MSRAVLEHNVARLLARSWRPARPEARFAARLERLLEERLAERAERAGAPALAVRAPAGSRGDRRAPWLALAAGVLFLLGAGALGAWILRSDGAPARPGDASALVASDPARATDRPAVELLGAPEDEVAARDALPPAPPARAVPPQEPAAAEALARLSGHVTDAADGEAIEEFRLVLVPGGGPFEPRFPEATSFDDPRGAFELPPRAPGPLEVYADAPGYAIARVEIELGPGPTPLPIALARGGRVSGVVRDAASGEPVAGASVLSEPDSPTMMLPVHAELAGEFSSRVATSDDGGRFVLEHVAAGPQVLRVLHPGHGVAWSETFELEEGGAIEDLVIELAAAGVVEGTVEDGAGRPLAGQQLIASTAGLAGDRRMTFGRAETDEHGRYAISGLCGGLHVLLWFAGDAAGPGDVRQIRPVMVAAGERARVDFRLEDPAGLEGARLDGRVVHADGSAAAGIVLWAARDGTSDDWRSTRTASDGSYGFTGLEPGTYGLCAGHSLGPDVVAVDWVTIDGSAPAARDVVLPGGALGGSVVDRESGAPLEAVVLLLQREDAAGAQPEFAGKALTDASGRYAFPYVGAGRYLVTAVDERGGRAFGCAAGVSLGLGEQRQLDPLCLGPGAVLRVLVREPDGRPVRGARVRIFGTDGSEYELIYDPRTDAEGAFVQRGLTAGPFDVRAELGARQSATRSTAPIPGETTEITLTLP